ncbi:hypothetical protein C8Q79DRAFT_495285 [Trametes meyenii]|nr:hypothetical protein C8Q79DRAFT_495285 [Trametes meyenii]
MSGTIASVAAQYLNRAYWKAPSSPQPLQTASVAARYRQEGSQQSLSVRAPHPSEDRSTGSATRYSNYVGATPPSFASASDAPLQLPHGAPVMSFGLTDESEESVACSSPECDHALCSPPRLVYSPASSSSLALDTPAPTTPFSPPTSDFAFLSPAGHSPPQDEQAALPVPTKSGSTLAERRGKKGLVLQGTPAAALPSAALDASKSELLSPRTPGSASSFAQRLVGFMRSPTPESSSPPEQEYPSDPFARLHDARPLSFYEDSCLLDAAPVRPHPDLYDLSVYAAPQPCTTVNSSSLPKKAAKDWRARVWLYVGVLIPDLVPASDPPVSHPPPPQPPLHSIPRTPSLSPTLDYTDVPPPSTTPISAPFSRSPRVYSPAATLSAHRLSTTIHLGPLANLRPLLLPQKFACREIAEAQATSISPCSTPNLRPLLLPQELARRASHPQYRARPRPATLPPSFERLSHQRAVSTSGIMSNNTPTAEAVASEPYVETGDSKAPHGERRRSQQLDDIISLLDQSGVLREADEQAATSGTVSDSEESAGIATPPSLLSRPGTSSPFSLVSQPHGDSLEETFEKSRRESHNLEDILVLLDDHRDEAIVKEGGDCLTDDGVVDESICAYAM